MITFYRGQCNAAHPIHFNITVNRSVIKQKGESCAFVRRFFFSRIFQFSSEIRVCEMSLFKNALYRLKCTNTNAVHTFEFDNLDRSTMVVFGRILIFDYFSESIVLCTHRPDSIVSNRFIAIFPV